MLRYVIETAEFNRILNLLYRAFNIRITFFDVEGCEHGYFDIKGMSAYCRTLRRDADFNRRCVACDRRHLDAAKQQRDIHVYRCHNGLLEGVVPLYDQSGHYLGSIVFGQLRPAGVRTRHRASPRLARLFRSLPVYSERRVRDVAQLLKVVTEYIVENELIRHRAQPWAETVEQYVEGHLGERLTVARLAQLIGKSASFVTHHFEKEFGLPAKRYVKKRRMEAAKALLQRGEAIYRVAATLGFYDEFHFSKAFKAHWGRPPKCFKQT